MMMRGMLLLVDVAVDVVALVMRMGMLSILVTTAATTVAGAAAAISF